MAATTDTPGSTAGPEPPGAAITRAAVAAQVTRNRTHAHQLDLYARMHSLCERDHEARRAAGVSRFNPTPVDETAIEMGGVLGVSEHRIKLDLHLRSRLVEWFPAMWRHCQAGRLDVARARIFVDAAEQLANEDDIARFAASLEAYFEKYDDPDNDLCTLSYDRLSRAARYRRMKYEQRSPAATFAEAFKKRQVWLRVEDNGIGGLGATGALHDLQACDYRLTLIAKKRCEDPDDDRTLAQMRADTFVDLLLGRLTVSASDADLEDDTTPDGEDPGDTFESRDVGTYARPVINVTVPHTTLMGLSDEPGLLGGEPIPADLARLIANDKNATWYRLLTDPAGDFVDLSTTSYQPTGPIWRHVTARDQLCVWPGCRRPATRSEKDHRVPFPDGTTSVGNLDNLCGRHHRAKHTAGYQVRRERNGDYVVTTPRGTRLRSRPTEQPCDEGARRVRRPPATR